MIYELPFEIDEYTPIEEVNRLCEMVEDLPEHIQEELSELQSYLAVSKNSVSMKTILSAIPAVTIWRMWLAIIWKKADSLGNFRHT